MSDGAISAKVRREAKENKEMSGMQETNKKEVAFLTCSDLHLSHNPPVARSCEKNWYGTMEWQLLQLHRLKEAYDVPLIYAGDIFDRWENPSELVNFLIQRLPRGFAVPGQHDLPFHSYKDIYKSSYWTLVESKVLINLEPQIQRFARGNSIDLVGFPWGYELRPFAGLRSWNTKTEESDESLKVAVVHRYCWRKNKRHPNATSKDHWKNIIKELPGFDVVVCGDNHQPFTGEKDGTLLINNGCFIRRKQDEINYRPRIGIVKKDKTVTFQYLDTSEEKFITGDDELSKTIQSQFSIEAEEFISKLKTVTDSSVNFIETLNRFMKDSNIRDGVKNVLDRAITEANNDKKKM